MSTALSTKQRRSRQAVIDALPGTCKQIVASSGLAIATVNRWVNILHKDDREIHISAWHKPAKQGHAAAEYVKGAGKDAPLLKMKDAPREIRLARRRELSGAKKRVFRDVRAKDLPLVPVHFLPAALMGQKTAFLLAGVWAYVGKNITKGQHEKHR